MIFELFALRTKEAHKNRGLCSLPIITHMKENAIKTFIEFATGNESTSALLNTFFFLYYSDGSVENDIIAYKHK